MAEIQKQRAHKNSSYLNMMEGSPKKMTKSQLMQLDKHKQLVDIKMNQPSRSPVKRQM